MKKLGKENYLLIASMLFGLFFGAGNLIFPIYMGYQAGGETWSALLGFLIAGVGLPFLGVIAMAVSGSDSVYHLASQVSERFARLFTFFLYLVIGPLFALPRLATTSFEIGVAPFFSSTQQPGALSVFSCVFFGLAFLFARRQGYLLEYIGKILNPLFLANLLLLLFIVFLFPKNDFVSGQASSLYQSGAFFQGFLDGYNTLDALAALAFGVVISSSIRELGVEREEEIAQVILRAGSLGMFGMGIIYTLLTLTGAMTNGLLIDVSNGGEIIARLSFNYLSRWGSLLLSLIIIIACLKTAIGLISSFANTFSRLFPAVNFKKWSIVASIVPMLIANLGLTTIIDNSKPVLLLLYPVAIVLILLTLLKQWKSIPKRTFQVTIFTVFFVSIPSAMNTLPTSLSSAVPIRHLVHWGSYLPLSQYGLGWLIPFALVLLVSLFLNNKKAITR